MMYLLVFIFVSTGWSVFAQNAAPLTVVRTWTGGCMGTFTIHADNAVHGWTCTLSFTTSLDKLDVSHSSLTD